MGSDNGEGVARVCKYGHDVEMVGGEVVYHFVEGKGWHL